MSRQWKEKVYIEALSSKFSKTKVKIEDSEESDIEIRDTKSEEYEDLLENHL